MQKTDGRNPAPVRAPFVRTALECVSNCLKCTCTGGTSLTCVRAASFIIMMARVTGGPQFRQTCPATMLHESLRSGVEPRGGCHRENKISWEWLLCSAGFVSLASSSWDSTWRVIALIYQPVSETVSKSSCGGSVGFVIVCSKTNGCCSTMSGYEAG